jgi:hypothetical protein
LGEFFDPGKSIEEVRFMHVFILSLYAFAVVASGLWLTSRAMRFGPRGLFALAAVLGALGTLTAAMAQLVS